MGYNHGLEEKKFKTRWKRLRKEYAAAGMSKEAIDAMEAFDRECLNGDRHYYEKKQSMDYRKVGGMHEENTSRSYLRKFGDRLRVEEQITDPARRYSWIDELDDEELVKAVKELKESDLDLLTRIVFEGFQQTDVADERGVTKQTVHERWGLIQKKMKKVLKNT